MKLNEYMYYLAPMFGLILSIYWCIIVVESSLTIFNKIIAIVVLNVFIIFTCIYCNDIAWSKS